MTPEDDSWPRRSYAWYVVAVLLVAYAFAILDRVAIGLLVQPIETDLHISDSQLGLLQGFAFGLFYSVMGLPLGWLMDRWPRRSLLALGIAVWSAATAACGAARGVTGLFLARMGVGVGEATITPGAASLIADYFPPESRPRAMGVYMLGATFGSSLAFILGGVAIDAAQILRVAMPAWLGGFSDWQIVFFIIGAPGVLLALVAQLTVGEPRRREKLGPHGSIRLRSLSFAPILAVLRQNRSAYVCLIGGAVLNVMCIYAQLAWYPTLFIRIHGWTAPEIGRALGLLGTPIGTISALSSGWVMSALARRGHADAPVLTALCQAVLLAVFGTASCLVPTPAMSLACYGVTGFATTWSYASALTGLNQITPNEMRGQVVAIYTLLVGLVSVGLGSFAVGFLSDHVFSGRKAIAPSLGCVYGLSGLAAAILLLAGRRPFRDAALRAKVWQSGDRQ